MTLLWVHELEPRRLRAAVLPADADGNAKVDVADFSVMASHFGEPGGATRATGDASGDGAVDLADFTLLAATFGQSAPVNGPLVITKPGTYSGGYYRSTDATKPAITVALTQPGAVTISDVTVRSAGDAIDAWGAAADLTISDSLLMPDGRGQALDATPFASAHIQNNTIVGGAGIKFHNWTGAGPLVVVRNTMTDVNGGYEAGHFLALDTIANLKNSEIAYNRVVNHLGKTNSEDVISLYRSGGASGSPLRIHDNLIDGSYYTTSPDPNFSGSGILLGDQGTTQGYVDVFNNLIMNTSNVGVGIIGGHDQFVHDNRIFAIAGDGSGNVGGSVWNSSSISQWANNTFTTNVVGWLKMGGTRNDWWLPNATSSSGNVHYDGTVDAKLIGAETARWLTALHGMKIGA